MEMQHKIIMLSLSTALCTVALNAMDNQQKDIANSTNQTWNGNDYDANSDPQFYWAMQALELLSLDNHKDKPLHVLDVGCGTGRVTHALAEKLPNAIVIGIDSSASMIQKAQEKYKENKNLFFVVHDAQKLSIQDAEAFDYIILTHVLHWIKDQQAVFNGVQTCLKPNGQMLSFSSAKTTSGAIPLLKAFLAVASQPEWAVYLKNSPAHAEQHIYPLDMAQLPSMLAEAKLTLIEAKDNIAVPIHFSDTTQFTNWVRPLAQAYPAFQNIPKDRQDQFIQDGVYEYLKMFPFNADHSVTYIAPDNAIIIVQK